MKIAGREYADDATVELVRDCKPGESAGLPLRAGDALIMPDRRVIVVCGVRSGADPEIAIMPLSPTYARKYLEAAS